MSEKPPTGRDTAKLYKLIDSTLLSAAKVAGTRPKTALRDKAEPPSGLPLLKRGKKRRAQVAPVTQAEKPEDTSFGLPKLLPDKDPKIVHSQAAPVAGFSSALVPLNPQTTNQEKTPPEEAAVVRRQLPRPSELPALGGKAGQAVADLTERFRATAKAAKATGRVITQEALKTEALLPPAFPDSTRRSLERRRASAFDLNDGSNPTGIQPTSTPVVKGSGSNVRTH